MKKIAACLLILSIASQTFAQGSLTPSGAPGATMKSLGEIDSNITALKNILGDDIGDVETAAGQIKDDPRIPISQAATAIYEPGSYYLTTNLVPSGGASGILIYTNNVTIDLNGFTIDGSSANGQGIFMTDLSNVLIKNGTIRDCGYFGISAFRTLNCRFENLTVIGNGRSGATYDGLHVGTNILVTGCNIIGNSCGLEVEGPSIITGNRIIGNTDKGIYILSSGSTVADNFVQGNGDNYDFAYGNQLNLLLCEVPENLEWPCSVKLNGTLICTDTTTNGITVLSDHVTIDLNGHALIGPGLSSGDAINQVDTFEGLTVKNGKISGWKDTYMAGVYAAGSGTLLSNLQISDCYYGIYTDESSLVSDCSANDNLNQGFHCTVNSTLTGCTARDNGASGIFVSGSTVSDCTATSNDGNGIYADAGATVQRCTAAYNVGYGIYVRIDSYIRDCSCDSNGYGAGDVAGIYVNGSDNRIDGNNVTDNDRGIEVTGTGNLIVRNSASGNTTDYDIVAGNQVGTITNSPVGASAWDNFEF